MWNFQVADAKNNPPPGSPNHDPLAKVCPLLEMCQMSFCLWYTPPEYISLDESTMAFKGRVKFLQFNPSKPNNFHIKLFMVSEHLSGYISRFLGGLSLHLNHLIAQRLTIYDLPFGTLPFRLFGSNLDTRDFDTYPRTYSGHF